jgi:hypothetical protein
VANMNKRFLIIFTAIVLSGFQLLEARPADPKNPFPELTSLVDAIGRHKPLRDTGVKNITDASQLRILRNAVYAANGYRFKSADLASYFQRYSWYRPRADSVKSFVNPVDRSNLMLIVWHEFNTDLRRLADSHEGAPAANRFAPLIGIWQVSPVMASGWEDSLQFFPNGFVIHRYNQMDCAKREILRAGTWSYQNHALTLRFTHE